MARRRRIDEADEERPARLVDAIIRHLDSDEEGAQVLTGDQRIAKAIDYVSTQCLSLDVALNMPGIPVGRLTVVRGWESSGKTTLITHLLAETQRRGGQAVLLDSEVSFDEPHAERLGVKLDELILMQPQTIEQCVDRMEASIKAIRQEADDVLATVVWDSVAATPPKSEVENDFGASKAIGERAKIIGAALRRIMSTIKRERIALVIVNQNREFVDTSPFAGAGESSVMPARRPLQFHSSVIIDLRRTRVLRRGEEKEPYGILSKVTVTKNKCSSPFGQAEMRCLFASGFDDDYAHFQLGVRIGMIAKKKSWYQMADVEGSFHEADFSEILEENPGLREKIAQAAREELWSPSVRQQFLEGKEEETDASDRG